MLDLPRPVVCGLITLHCLAKRDRPVPADEIAREYLISKSLLHRVLCSLRLGGLIRGRCDKGIVLTRPATSITVADVLQAFARPTPRSSECQMDYRSCTHRTVCPVAALCRESHEKLEGLVRSVTVADLGREAVQMP